jgi:hypothetical protein
MDHHGNVRRGLGDNMSDRTKQIIDDMAEWEKTASDRDIQVQMLRVAVETREKIETIRSIVTFLFVLWLIGVVAVVIAAAANSGT